MISQGLKTEGRATGLVAVRVADVLTRNGEDDVTEARSVCEKKKTAWHWPIPAVSRFLYSNDRAHKSLRKKWQGDWRQTVSVPAFTALTAPGEWGTAPGLSVSKTRPAAHWRPGSVLSRTRKEGSRLSMTSRNAG